MLRKGVCLYSCSVDQIFGFERQHGLARLASSCSALGEAGGSHGCALLASILSSIWREDVGRLADADVGVSSCIRDIAV